MELVVKLLNKTHNKQAEMTKECENILTVVEKMQLEKQRISN